jgi:PPOX class probable F420-dependent enzyme
MAKLTEAQRAFVRDNPFYAILTTLRADGSPHSTVVWADEQDGQLVFNTARGRVKDRNLVADPRASLAILDPGNPYRWLSVSGTIVFDEQGADANIDALARKYTGADYTMHREGETRVIVTLSPEKVDSVGL